MESEVKGTPAPVVDAATRQRGDTIKAGALLFIVTFLVFSPALSFPFLNYDDPDFILSNGAVQMGLSWASIKWAFTSLFVYWQPLTWISYMADFHFWKLDPSGYHLTNVLLHLASTLLVFGFLQRTTRQVWPSAMVAALFALHPLHVETVAWIAERKGALCSFFWMLTMWTYAAYAERPSWGRYLLTALLFACALMSKPMAVTLPFALLLLDFWPLNRWRPGGAEAKGEPGAAAPASLGRLVAEKVPLLVLSVIAGFLTIRAQENSAAVMSLEQLPLMRRLGLALTGYLGYLRKTLWPSDLTAFYPFPEPPSATTLALAAGILAAITLLALWKAKKAPWVLVGWLWFVGTMLPVSGLLQAGDQAMADRYTYVPLIGLFFAVVWSLAEAGRNLASRRVLLGAPAFVAVGACIVVSGVQLRTWSSTVALAEHAARVTSGNYVALAMLANAHAEKKDWEKARESYEKALGFKERYADGHFGFATMLAAEGDLPEAIKHFNRALELNPAWAEAHDGLGQVYLRQNLATEAVKSLEQAVRFKPGLQRTRASLATALQMLGRTEEAAVAYAAAAGVHEKGADLYMSFGNFLVAGQHLAEAIPCFQKAVELEPKATPALTRLAWIYATHPNAAIRNGSEAVRLAQRASDLTNHGDALTENALAAAYAEVGDYVLAVETAEKAINLAIGAGQNQILAILRALADKYKAGKPHRE